MSDYFEVANVEILKAWGPAGCIARSRWFEQYVPYDKMAPDSVRRPGQRGTLKVALKWAEDHGWSSRLGWRDAHLDILLVLEEAQGPGYVRLDASEREQSAKVMVRVHQLIRRTVATVQKAAGQVAPETHERLNALLRDSAMWDYLNDDERNDLLSTVGAVLDSDPAVRVAAVLQENAAFEVLEGEDRAALLNRIREVLS